MLTNFKELKEIIKNGNARPRKVAVVQAASHHVLESIIELSSEGLLIPILIGNQNEIRHLLYKYGWENNSFEIVHVESDEEAAFKGVELIREGEADFLMKGHLSTGTLLKQVVNRESGIRKRNVLSHLALIAIPSYPKLIGITDGGMVLVPSIDQKEEIIQNAKEVMYALGFENPKMAILSAAETYQPKLPASVDARKLTDLFQTERGCVVEGPISFDIALNVQVAKEKGYKGEIQGDADVLIVSDIVTGNAVAKSLTLFGEGEMAGLILGASVPIIVTSRTSTASEKTNSILLAYQLTMEKQNKENKL